ncbi:MAG: Stealth CR1 domain-containing protein [Clostridia bacterium]|nr:Stealth CR1 domain-containing protein [Clostridia bacterium]
MKDNQTKPEAIDFVITWVDGSDPAWLERKRSYMADSADDRPQRYRDWGLLPYWFRGVEKYAPWVRKIHFVTCGHLPAWLDTSNPRLNVVNHADFIPEKYLPTFNSNPIELNLFRIKDLSERFVYFNDDTMMIGPVKPTDFFKDGKPVDMLALQPVVANPENPTMSHILLNDSMVICKYFDKRAQMKKNFGKFFKPGYPAMYFIYNLLEFAFPLYTGFYTVHGPSPMMKSTYEELWEKEAALFDEVSSHKLRCDGDVTQYIFREWEKQKGNFVPRNLHRVFRYLDLSDTSGKNEKIITGRKYKSVCVNDTDKQIDFEKTKKSILTAFDSILPERSSFEKQSH